MFIFHWFYKVVREQLLCFIGFTRLFANSDVFFLCFAMLSTTSDDFSLSLQGCPRKRFLFHMVYKVVREKLLGVARRKNASVEDEKQTRALAVVSTTCWQDLQTRVVCQACDFP